MSAEVVEDVEAILARWGADEFDEGTATLATASSGRLAEHPSSRRPAWIRKTSDGYRLVGPVVFGPGLSLGLVNACVLRTSGAEEARTLVFDTAVYVGKLDVFTVSPPPL